MVEEQAPWEYQRALIIITVLYCVEAREKGRGDERGRRGKRREMCKGAGPQSRRWWCAFLQTTDTECCNFNFSLLWRCCAYALVWFRHTSCIRLCRAISKSGRHTTIMKLNSVMQTDYNIGQIVEITQNTVCVTRTNFNISVVCRNQKCQHFYSTGKWKEAKHSWQVGAERRVETDVHSG